MAMIEVEHLTRRYGTTLAIQDLDFSVEQGEIVGFLGPNGAGKSTTMRILAGGLGATEGDVRIDGVDVVRRPREVKRRIGYLPEVPPLYPEMRVRDFLRFCGRIKEVDDPGAAADRVISRVGLEGVSHRLIQHLSKGFRQRVGVAQALVHQPRVLILDEPSSGLDPAQRVEIRELVKELARGDVTVILSTHVLPEIEAICDRVIILHEGRIVAQDTVERLVGEGHRVDVRVERPSEALRARLMALGGVSEVRVEGARYRVIASRDVRAPVAAVAVEAGLLSLGSPRGLEEAFLELTMGEPR